MKLIHVAILVGLLILGWLAWTELPGLRTRVSDTVEEYGGWTDEARQADPVGFLSHAEEKLAEDIEAFRISRESLAATRDNAEAELERNRGLLAAAEELAGAFRASYRLAENVDNWPALVQGARYSRDELIEQVESILNEKATYERVVATYTEVIAAAEEQRKALRTRIQTSEATLVELRAQKELVRVEQLTSQTDELLAQVDALLVGNRETLVALDEPVRSVEALLAASGDPGAPSAGPSNALEFLGAD